ncbi:CU044_2847 family protein [Zoogloea sp. 1C4]|uniref:CU044_2847 family protein n=1 Tax=Zoogloea sp. 1C4 TaxID=2570190 RepID=UPI0012910574|nr:CU044_2847 family protein [Zoogloea sp. 1C4]
MTRQIEQIEINGQMLWVEAESVSQVVGAPKKSGRFADTSAATTTADALKKVDVAATLAAVVSPAKDALDKFKPDEVSLELTLGFKADIGVFVASGEANAQLKVNVKWKTAAPASKD